MAAFRFDDPWDERRFFGGGGNPPPGNAEAFEQAYNELLVFA